MGDEIDLRERVAAIRRRWDLATAVAVAVFGAVALVTLTQRKVYESTAKLVVASKKNGDVQLGSILSGDLSMKGGDTQTQVEIVNSPKLIRKAYESLDANV